MKACKCGIPYGQEESLFLCAKKYLINILAIYHYFGGRVE